MEKVAVTPARLMRFIWLSFVSAGVMFIYIAFTIPAQGKNTAGPAVETVITVVALVVVLLGFFMPRILRWSAKRAREGQTGSAALKTWFTNNLVGLAWIYSCNLFAMVLHFLRARVGLVAFLFGVGMISLLLWRPGTPPDCAEKEGFTQI